VSTDPHLITSIEQLETVYKQRPVQHALQKVTNHLTEPYQAWIEASPFLALATVGPNGMDCSPRGDEASAVTVVDETTIHLPDRRGNNRIDSLRNIVADGRVALLFLVPGAGECLRINGTAVVSTDPALLEAHSMNGKQPRSIIVITIGEVYFQCARAIKRSHLWDPDRRPGDVAVPTAGQMTEAAGATDFDPAGYDAALADRQAATLY
jgi:PPOX class probable FMN-dependent enzyme